MHRRLCAAAARRGRLCSLPVLWELGASATAKTHLSVCVVCLVMQAVGLDSCLWNAWTLEPGCQAGTPGAGLKMRSWWMNILSKPKLHTVIVRDPGNGLGDD